MKAGTINIQKRLVINLFVCLALIAFNSEVFASTSPQHSDETLRNALIKAINETDSFQNRFDAEVWLTDYSHRLKKRIKDDKKRIELLKAVHFEAKRANLPPEMVLAVIDVESNFDRWAISSAGARGLMQIMPFWLKEIGRPDDNLFHVNINLRFGCTILRHYLDMEKGNYTRALGRYNGSLGSSKYPNKVFTALHQHWYKR
ncbi:MAG TPA: lytic transglycosylase domain-containing protein [Gammaproteobacteria bacterium]|nr:lytic transglycosylase domain-containing protein [Gammaproteobacteria bacterium]